MNLQPQRRSEPSSHQSIRPSNAIGTPAQLLLTRLEGVVTAGKGWRAHCPNCGGKSRKLSVTEGDNGTLLVTCFSCHDTAAILSAVGLQMGDLFQRRDFKTMTPSDRSQFKQAALIPRWQAALDVLVREAGVLLIVANKLGEGEALDDGELTRVRLSAVKIFDAKEILHAR